MAYRIRPQVLDKIRAEQGYSSDEALAHGVGLSLGTVSGIRRGKEPSFRTVVKLLDAARITNLNVAIARVDEQAAA